MKFLNYILAVMFLLFAAVQYNDPDPIQWMALYVLTSLVCILATFNKTNIYLIYIGLTISLLWGLSISPDFFAWLKEGTPTIAGTMKAENPHVELVREFLGLLLVSATLAWQSSKIR